MKKTIAVVLILVAVSLGFLHGASRFKAQREREREAAQPQPAPPRRPPSDKRPAAGAPAPPAAPAPPTAAPPEKPDTTEADLEAARKAIDEGERAIERGDFAAAKKAHAEAARRAGALTSVAALPLARLAQRGEARAEVLGALAASIQPNDFASGEGLTRLALKGEGGQPGREYVARVLDVTDHRIRFRLASGVELELPRAELARAVEPCPKEEWRGRVERGFAERKERTDPENAFEQFRLAAFALENGLRELAAPALARALERDRLGVLPEYFCEPRSRPAPATVQLARGGTEAEVAGAASGGGEPGEGTEPGTGTGTGTEPGPGERPVVIAAGDIRGNAKYKAALERLAQGIEHYKKSFRGNPQAESELKSALAIFNEVGSALEALKDDFPRSGLLDEKIVAVNQMRVDCRKRAAIGG